MPIGFDCGTFNLICSRKSEGKEGVTSKREINAFIEVPLENPYTFNALKDVGVPLIERKEGKMAYAVGEAAVNIAYTWDSIPLKRPMAQGCVNPKEKSAFNILKTMIHSLMGEVSYDGETVCYSIPANAINDETDADYHRKVLESIFKSYEVNGKKINPVAINEALALVYAELGNKMLTGVGMSCLCPGTKIYTDRGILNIEDVELGDKVITHKGRWREVKNIIVKHFEGTATKMQLQGYSDNTDCYKFVDNHELYVKRNNEWQWVGCEEVEEGEIVGEPIIKRERPEGVDSINMTICERTTSSKEYIKKKIEVSADVQRLIGYFLGDGSLIGREQGIQFDFGPTEQKYVDDVQEILKKNFSKGSSFIDRCNYEDNQGIRVRCYSKGMYSWFKNHCYKSGVKIYPWDVSRLNRTHCISLLCGLIRSDGFISNKTVSFHNTDTTLIILVKQLFSKLGIAANVGLREPRENTLGCGRIIEGKKDEWRVSAGCKFSNLQALKEIIENINCSNSRFTQRLFVEGDFCCSRVQKVEYEHYKGEVYDLQIEEDHSFSGPFLTIHNCGAGMINVCYANMSVPVFQFSLVNSGDWIDERAAKAVGESPTFINKEKHKINLLKEPENMIERAIQTQYRLMIENTVKGIKDGFDTAAKKGKKVRTDHPVDIVVAGGTASPEGFDKLVKETIDEVGLPIEIGEIRRPKDHLYAVARGCLRAAERSEEA